MHTTLHRATSLIEWKKENELLEEMNYYKLMPSTSYARHRARLDAELITIQVNEKVKLEVTITTINK